LAGFSIRFVDISAGRLLIGPPCIQGLKRYDYTSGFAVYIYSLHTVDRYSGLNAYSRVQSVIRLVSEWTVFNEWSTYAWLSMYGTRSLYLYTCCRQVVILI